MDILEKINNISKLASKEKLTARDIDISFAPYGEAVIVKEKIALCRKKKKAFKKIIKYTNKLNKL